MHPRSTDTSPRAQVERSLGSRLHDDEWDLLIRKNFVGQGQENEKEDTWIEDAVDEIKDNRKTYGLPSRPAPPKAPPVTTTPLPAVDNALTYGLSALLAIRANEHPWVKDFRRRHLGDRAMLWKDVDEWVERQAKLDGPPTRYAQIPVFEQATPEDVSNYASYGGLLDYVDEGVLSRNAALVAEEPEFILCHWRFRELHYLVPYQPDRRVPTARGGVLYSLRSTASVLTNEYPWQEELTIVWVLTGIIPPLHLVSGGASVFGRHPWKDKLLIEAHPLATAKDVTDFYEEHRERLLRRHPRRIRSKQALLALFAGLRLYAGRGWEEIMRDWNVNYAAKLNLSSYTYTSNLRRDAHNAIRDLLGEDDNPQPDEEEFTLPPLAERSQFPLRYRSAEDTPTYTPMSVIWPEGRARTRRRRKRGAWLGSSPH